MRQISVTELAEWSRITTKREPILNTDFLFPGEVFYPLRYASCSKSFYSLYRRSYSFCPKNMAAKITMSTKSAINTPLLGCDAFHMDAKNWYIRPFIRTCLWLFPKIWMFFFMVFIFLIWDIAVSPISHCNHTLHSAKFWTRKAVSGISWSIRFRWSSTTTFESLHVVSLSLPIRLIASLFMSKNKPLPLC